MTSSHALAQLGIDVVVDRELPGVDDAHVHAGLDGVIEEHRVHRLAHRLVAAERERQVRDAAGDMRMRQVLLDLARRLDEIDAVVVVLLDAGRDREDVGVEDDVFRREADLLGQQLVGAVQISTLRSLGVGLPLFVERHHDDGGAIARQPGLLEELILAFLHRDRVDDRLALHALQARPRSPPISRVDHHRHAGDVGLGGDQVEEGRPSPARVEQALVHVDVDDLRAVFDLLARHVERLGIVARR
jgi:hypothetical protein